MSIEAMKQALEALEQWNTPLYKRGNVIEALRQAIAEEEKKVFYSGNGSAGRENTTAPTGFFFQMPKAEKQEPVAYMYPDDLEEFKTREMSAHAYSLEMVSPTQGETVPLYTHPQPKREWVGLTLEEVSAIWDSMATWNSTSLQELYNVIWQALKEKNNQKGQTD